MRGTRLLRAAGVAAALVLVGALCVFLAPAQAAPWRPAGLSGVAVSHLSVDGSGVGIVYAALQPGAPGVRTNLQKTVDGGRTWVSVERGLPAQFAPAALAVSPGDGRQVLAAGGGALFRSATAGASWNAVRTPLPPVTALLFDAASPRNVLAGTELHGNFRSTDGGMTWRHASLGLPRDRYGYVPGAVQLVQDPSSPSTIYMAANGFDGVYRSADGGVSWAAMGAGLPSHTVTQLALNPSSPGDLYAVTDKGIAKWDASGAWKALGDVPVMQPVAVEFEPGAKDVLYVAGAQGTLVRSTTNGATWTELPALPRPVRSLAAWPTSTNAILAAAAGEGVWELPLRPTLPASKLPPAANRQYFPETGHNVSATFLPFFRQMGGIDRFGLPRTEELTEDGLTVQYFQRARLEYHPERKGTAYEVQISLIGEWLLGPERPPRAEPLDEDSDEQKYFPETGHTVSYAFLRYYRTRGSLDSLGYPLTEELQENGRPVQYFQRARLEYVEEFKGTRDEVQLGLIGDEVLKQKDWLE